MISVIIPTTGRLHLLCRMLEAAQTSAQTAAGAEILVVDTGGQAETQALCARLSGQSHDIRYIKCHSRALHAGRHAGVRAALGDVLLFADDDIVPSESWVAALADAFSDPQVVLAGGSCLPDFESKPPSWVQELWQPGAEGGRVLGQFSLVERKGPTRPVSPFEIYGCNFAIRRQVLLDAGGFHPDGVPAAHLRFRGDGETAVSAHVLASGLKCIHVEGAAIRHHVSAERMTYTYLFRRSFAQGVSDSYTKIRRNGQPDWVPRATRIRDGLSKWYPSRSAPWTKAMTHLPATAREVLSMGYAQGVFFHQREVRRDAQLLAWVLRKDYWDIGLPGEK